MCALRPLSGILPLPFNATLRAMASDECSRLEQQPSLLPTSSSTSDGVDIQLALRVAVRGTRVPDDSERVPTRSARPRRLRSGDCILEILIPLHLFLH